nr:helix-turn-helix transcriptional regulator [uncultured Caproiciproducens sp.]
MMEKAKMEIMQKTAEQIKHLRKVEGFSQKSLAVSAGLDPAFLGHIERCLKCPTIDTLNKIALALNISLSELLDFGCSKKYEKNDGAIKKITIMVNKLSTEEADQLAEIVTRIVQFKLHDALS